MALRAAYICMSWILTVCIWLYYLPSLLLFAPISFITSKWDDTVLLLLSLAGLLAFYYTCALAITQFYLYIKPAFTFRELQKIKWFLLWTCIFSTLALIVLPWLIWVFPYFLLTYHSDTLVMIPSLADLISTLYEMSYFLLLIWAIPLLIHFNINRIYVYMILSIFASLICEYTWFFIVITVLFLIYEFVLYLSLVMDTPESKE